MAEHQVSRPCPKCAGFMELVTVAGVEVDRCRMCRGIWFDADEVMKLRAQPGAESVDDGSPFIGCLKDAKSDIDCPICKVRMVPFKPPRMQREFTLELCTQCKGMFFDAGEFHDFVLDQSFWEALKQGD